MNVTRRETLAIGTGAVALTLMPLGAAHAATEDAIAAFTGGAEVAEVAEGGRVDAQAAKQQVNRLRRLRRKRDDAQVTRSLEQLAQAAQGTDNVVPPILQCVESYCTLGEICQVFRDVFGEQGQMSAF